MEKASLKALLDSMSLKEKADQMLQIMGAFYLEETNAVLTGPAKNMGLGEDDIRMAGSILGSCGAETLKKIQDQYMARHPHKIPLLFMMDVIHGMKTTYPMPLAQGATFEPELSRQCAAMAAKEAAVSGLHVTFAPMVDLVRDARWGRVMESTGEDPYLNSLFARAMVEGFQGEELREPYRVAACVKHFAAYGGAEAGRDYNTVELSEHTLRQSYLPAYQAGIDAGAALVMTSFNTVNGIPATTNQWLMRDILRDEMGFDGVLISDFAAIAESIAHGHAADEGDAADKAIQAGVDIDMMTGIYAGNLCRLVTEGAISEELINDAVMRILELKNKLGLFENPYKDGDADKEKEIILCPEHRALARKAAVKSFVLLKNEAVLPLDKQQKIAFIGPYVNNQELLSSWAVTAEKEDCITIEAAAVRAFANGEVTYHNGCPVIGRDVELIGFREVVTASVDEKQEAAMRQEALAAAAKADLVIMPLGEHYLQSGEAASRGFIEIPEVQMELFRKVQAVNPNVVVVLITGRPLDIRELSSKAKAVLVAWRPGTEGGNGIIDVLTGAEAPSGKLPMSFPYSVGQVPVHYDAYMTGRPWQEGEKDRFKSRYQDIPNKPLYPFGFGLTYTEFSVSPIVLSADTLTDQQPITARILLRNQGKAAGEEVVQLYLHDKSASVVRPVKELKAFEKIKLNPGEEREVVFTIDEPMLRFLTANKKWESEAGEFDLFIGTDSTTVNKAEFIYQKI